MREGLEANFARWLAFIGAVHGEWIELQALKIPTRYGKKNRFAHADSVAAALPLLRQGDTFGAQGVFVIANRVNPAVATRTTPRAWYDAEKGASTTDSGCDPSARALRRCRCPSHDGHLGDR